jgi:hypothetical protein
MTTWKNGPGSQVNADARQLDAARRGVPVSQARIAEPATQFTAEQQKALAGAANRRQLRRIRARPSNDRGKLWQTEPNQRPTGERRISKQNGLVSNCPGRHRPDPRSRCRLSIGALCSFKRGALAIPSRASTATGGNSLHSAGLRLMIFSRTSRGQALSARTRLPHQWALR